MWRSRWAALGAAVAVSLGAGGFGLAQGAIDSGDKPVAVTIAPQRILDTRVDLGLPGAFVDEVPRDVQVTGAVPVASGGTATVVPSSAVAVLVNVTVVNSDSEGYLSLRPAGAAGSPTTSTVNFTVGTTEPNAATVDLAGGKVQVFLDTYVPDGTAHVLVDVVGYTVDHTHDDRYPTDGEVDAALDQLAQRVKSFSINPRSVGVSGSAVQAGPAPPPFNGVALPNAGSPGIDFGFTLPMDYVAGDPIRVLLRWHVDEADCSFEPFAYYSTLARYGNALATFNQEIVPPRVQLVSHPANVSRRTTFALQPAPGVGFQPGDSLFVNYVRDGGDECSETVLIDGIQVRYG